MYRRSLRRWTSERFSRVAERRSSRHVSVTTRQTWMPSPDPSLSMIESGYESDPSCRGRDWMSSLTDCESVMLAGSEQCDRMSDGLRPDLLRTSSVVAGDPLPTNCELIEIHVSELKQLFNAIDPSPFRERDFDPHAEEFITDWAKEASPSEPVCVTT